MEEDDHSRSLHFSPEFRGLSKVMKKEDRHANPTGNVNCNSQNDKEHMQKELKCAIRREPTDIPMASSRGDTRVPSYPQEQHHVSVKPSSHNNYFPQPFNGSRRNNPGRQSSHVQSEPLNWRIRDPTDIMPMTSPYRKKLPLESYCREAHDHGLHSRRSDSSIVPSYPKHGSRPRKGDKPMESYPHRWNHAKYDEINPEGGKRRNMPGGKLRPVNTESDHFKGNEYRSNENLKHDKPDGHFSTSRSNRGRQKFNRFDGSAGNQGVETKPKFKERDKSWFESVQSFPVGTIMSLSKLESEKFVNELFSKIKGLQSTLQRPASYTAKTKYYECTPKNIFKSCNPFNFQW